MKNKCLIYLFFLCFKEYEYVNCAFKPIECDLRKDVSVSEGNIGQSKYLAWIGVLRTHIHEGKNLKIAVTGIVLISSHYAIGNAEDITKIPIRVYKDDTKAMFIPRDGEPWFAKLISYMAHPEFEFSTQNTIALLELSKEGGIPVIPICLPQYAYNTSSHLYAVGYTDEHKLMEKVIYRLQYVEKNLCEEFYEKTGSFEELQQRPTHYQCGAALNNKEHCQWDNGMALVSNASGIWTLIGFGIRGPGCGAPARFIDMYDYTAWIETTTGLEDGDDQVFDQARRGLRVAAGQLTPPGGKLGGQAGTSEKSSIRKLI